MKIDTLKSNSVRRVAISGFPFTYRRWTPGERMPAQLIAFDTETDLIKGYEIPPLALAMASSGRQNVLIHPDDVGKFILTHPQADIVCHNAAFDFWVIDQHLSVRGETKASKVWTQFVVNRRLHDTMYLDVLLRLSRGNVASKKGGKEKIPTRNLAEVVREYTGLEVSKEDPYRLRFGELIGRDWAKVEPGFFEYAIKDTICTLCAYREMRERATEVMAAQGYTTAKKARYYIYHDASARFGLLSEAIQVEAAIALSSLSRNGLHTNLQRLEAAETAFREEFEPVIDEIRSKYPGVFPVDASGNPMLTASGLPQESHKKLDEELNAAVAEIREQTGTDVIVPKTEKGGVSHALGLWEHLLDQHPFLKLWGAYKRRVNLKQFFEKLKRPVIHPEYTVLVRTGRTSCSSPNMQQVPRDDTFRQVIVPSPGHLLLTVDYSYAELVTLAAVCQARFGFSHLGDVIRKGIDPHCYTAAMLANVPLKEFMRWKQSDPGRFKSARQKAKPVNFGVPGGMGPEALVNHARSLYNVQMSLQQAKNFHHRLTTEIYPEIGRYLADDGLSQLAQRLNVSESVCRDRFCFRDMSPPKAAGTVRKIVRGQPIKKDGQPYKPALVTKTWDNLKKINRNPTFATDLNAGVGSPQLAARLFPNAVVTLTGRVRGNVEYTQQRNTPFQSLASDGAKRALWHLVLAGFRVVGFIHDEILIELPDQGDYVDHSVVKSVVKIMCDSMLEMTDNVPVKCEYTLSDRWSKNAELILDGDKVRPWRPLTQSDHESLCASEQGQDQ